MILSLFSCGSHIQFDALDSSGNSSGPNAQETDLNQNISYLIASQVFVNDQFNSLEVDWDRKIIYGGNSSSNECFSMFSFADTDNISLIARINNASVPAMEFDTCRNIQLYDNGTKLLAASNNSRRLTRYDLGTTPEDPSSWGTSPPSFNASAGDFTRAIPFVSTNGVTTQIYLASHEGWFHIELTETTDTFVEQARYEGTSFNNTSVFDINNGYVLTRHYNSTTQDIILTDLATGNVSATNSGSLPVANGISSNYWTQASDPNGNKHVLLGAVAIFIDTSGASPVITRMERLSSGVYRDAVFASKDSKDYVYAITGGHQLDVYDITDIANPTLESRTTISEMQANESYGIDVNLDLNQAVIGTNKGVVALIDLRGLATPTEQNIYVPRVSVSGTSVNETDAGGLDLNINLDGATTEAVTVNWQTVDGTATAGADFTAGSGSVTFQPGETQQTINVALVNDGSGEGSESFQVLLDTPSGVVIQSDTANITLND